MRAPVDLSLAEHPLRMMRSFLRKPGRVLYLPLQSMGCPCCDPASARDDLEGCLHLDRTLRRVVAALDAEYLRRTLPDPHASPDLPWWWRRMRDYD